MRLHSQFPRQHLELKKTRTLDRGERSCLVEQTASRMEMAVGAASRVVVQLVRGVVVVLKDALQLQGARGLDLERPTSGDTPLHQVPELPLNICMVSEMFLQILATGLGALALVWATVVLLGGFSTYLHKADFWVITAIVFIQTARYLLSPRPLLMTVDD